MAAARHIINAATAFTTGLRHCRGHPFRRTRRPAGKVIVGTTVDRPDGWFHAALHGKGHRSRHGGITGWAPASTQAPQGLDEGRGRALRFHDGLLVSVDRHVIDDAVLLMGTNLGWDVLSGASPGASLGPGRRRGSWWMRASLWQWPGWWRPRWSPLLWFPLGAELPLRPGDPGFPRTTPGPAGAAPAGGESRGWRSHQRWDPAVSPEGIDPFPRLS